MLKIIKQLFYTAEEKARDNWSTLFYEFIDSYEREYNTSSDEKKAHADAYIKILKVEIEYHRLVKLFSDAECNHFRKWLATTIIKVKK